MPLAKITDLDRLEKLYETGARHFVCDDDGNIFAVVSVDIGPVEILGVLAEFPRLHSIDAYETIYGLRERRGIYDRPPLVSP